MLRPVMGFDIKRTACALQKGKAMMGNTPVMKKNTPVMKKNTPAIKKNTPAMKKNTLAMKKMNYSLLRADSKMVRALRLLMVVLVIGSVLPRIFFTATGTEWNTLTYYTIQTNLLMGGFWTFTALRPACHARTGFQRLRFMLTVAILITGSLYFLLLHRVYMASLSHQHEIGIMSSGRYGMYVADAWINHFAVPLAALADFLLIRPNGHLTRSDMAWPMIIPFAYFIFHTARGLATGFYAYNFIDPGAMGGWWNVMAMFSALAVFALLLTLGCYFLNNRFLSPRREHTS